MITKQDLADAQTFLADQDALLAQHGATMPPASSPPAQPPAVASPPAAPAPAAGLFSALPWASSPASVKYPLTELESMTELLRIYREEICNHFPELAAALTPHEASLACFRLLRESTQLNDCLLNFQTQLALQRARS